MPKEVIMPALGMSQDSGILVAWLKQAGDSVRQGEPIMEIETDKVTVEIEAPASGILAHLRASAGDEVPVGETIAWIFALDEAIPERIEQVSATRASQPATKSESKATGGAVASPVAARIAAQHNIDLSQVNVQGSRITKADVEAYLNAQAAGNGSLIPASPKARRLAQENSIDLASLRGSGPNGAVLTVDVLAAVTAPLPAQSTTISRTWQIMAQRLAESWRTVPHFYLQREVDARQLIAWRTAAMKRTTEKITYTDLLVKLVAAALREHPQVNAMWQDNTIVFNKAVHIGLAVAVEDGLLVPVIHNADQLALTELASRRKELVAHAQEGKLSPAEVQGGTFTISNLGMYGIDGFSAIVNPPQAAILAVGRIVEKAVPREGQLSICPMMMLNLSCDHRVVDGARGAAFLSTLAALIEEPLALIR